MFARISHVPLLRQLDRCAEGADIYKTASTHLRAQCVWPGCLPAVVAYVVDCVFVVAFAVSLTLSL